MGAMGTVKSTADALQECHCTSNRPLALPRTAPPWLLQDRTFSMHSKVNCRWTSQWSLVLRAVTPHNSCDIRMIGPSMHASSGDPGRDHHLAFGPCEGARALAPYSAGHVLVGKSAITQTEGVVIVVADAASTCRGRVRKHRDDVPCPWVSLRAQRSSTP
jgi:hypothetical protein